MIDVLPGAGEGWRVTDDQRKKLQCGLGLFDFDGTLIPWDTQVVFAHFVLKREPLRRAYLPFFATFAPLYKILGDEGLKRVFLSYLWRVERYQLQDWVEAWVAEWVPGRCYGEVIARLEGHRQAGHLTVLASASPEFYVREVGRVLGFDFSLGTEVEFEDRMPLFPELTNHKGVEKVRRLSEIIGTPGMDGWANSHGYTDSAADLPMMLACGSGTVVNPSKRLTGIATQRHWEILRPEVPWTGKADKSQQILRFAAGI